MAPLVTLYRDGEGTTAADLFLSRGVQTDWRAEVRATVPGGEEQAMRDVATFFEQDVPAVIGRAILHIRRCRSCVDAEEGLQFPAQALSVGEVERHVTIVAHGCQVVRGT